MYHIKHVYSFKNCFKFEIEQNLASIILFGAIFTAYYSKIIILEFLLKEK